MSIEEDASKSANIQRLVYHQIILEYSIIYQQIIR